MFKQLTKLLVEKALEAEMAVHLGHGKNEPVENPAGNMSLYARGMTVREIQPHLEERHGTEVSPTLISSVTDAVIEEVKTWQSRPWIAFTPSSISTAST